MSGLNENSKALLAKLQEYPKKRIELEALKSLCSCFADCRDCIIELVEYGCLTPIKSSKTDGNLQKPLYHRYNICIEKKQIFDEEMYALNPRIVANEYLLRNPEKFLTNKAFLQHLSQWMSGKSDNETMSRRERSFAVFGDEKALDTHLELLKRIGLSGENLGYYDTPEQCFSDYIPVRKPQMTLLVCENKDIWFDIRRLMYDGANTLFNVRLDGVIFGQGNDITGKGKFLSYVRFLGAKELKIIYCGDIDRAGFDIFLRLCRETDGLSVSLFVPAYKKMLELCRNITLPNSDDERGKIPDISEQAELFSDYEREQIFCILKENKRLPQEILSYPVLAENMR